MTKSNAIVWAAGAVFFALLCYIHFESAASGDRSWLIYASGQLLLGKKIYVDIVEINPLLILWLYMLPAGFAHYMSLTGNELLVVVGVLLALYSSGLGRDLIAQHPAFEGNRKKHLQFAVLLLGVFLATNPAYFADRDHLMLMLVCPFLLRFMPSLASKTLPAGTRFAIGIMAGIGFLIKPHIFLMFCVLQLYYLLRERSLRIAVSLENIIIYILSAAYITAVLVYTPEYYRIIMPMALATYSAFSNKLRGFIYYGFTALIIFAVTFVDFRPRDASPYRRDIYYLLLLCVGFLLYALMNNGWGYTYNPLISMLLIATGFTGWEFGYLRRKAQAEGAEARRYAFGARAAAFNLGINALLAVFIPLIILFSYCPSQNACYAWGRSLNATAKNVQSFGTINLNYDPWARLSQSSGARWDTRFNHLWMIPKFLMNGPDFAAKNQWILQYVADALAEDMDKRKPDIMIVDSNMTLQFSPVRVDLPAYLSIFPKFRSAWSHYRFDSGVGHCPASSSSADSTTNESAAVNCYYMLYRRAD